MSQGNAPVLVQKSAHYRTVARRDSHTAGKSCKIIVLRLDQDSVHVRDEGHSVMADQGPRITIMFAKTERIVK